MCIYTLTLSRMLKCALLILKWFLYPKSFVAKKFQPLKKFQWIDLQEFYTLVVEGDP